MIRDTLGRLARVDREVLAAFVHRPNLGLLQNIAGRPPWALEPNLLPWSDRPDALDELARRRKTGRVTARDAELLEQWIRDGYLILDGMVSERDIDELNADVDALWQDGSPRRLKIHDLRPHEGAAPRTLSHASVLALPRQERHRMRDRSRWRIHELHRHLPSARRLFDAPEPQRLAGLIFGERAEPYYTIQFMYGSEQAIHQDMAVFHIYPHNFLIGAWIALEDISPDCGPLAFHPGSHREPLFSGFAGYPQTNLRNCGDAIAERYDRYIDELKQKYPRHELLAKKGQLLLWHAMLLHGGTPIRRPELTRRSFVIHYHARRADRGSQVLGPFSG